MFTPLFRIQEQVVREYVLEFLSSFTFREHIMELANVDTMVFQLGGVIKSRHSGKEKVTLDDLFLYNGLGLGEMVDDLPDDGRNEVAEAVEGQGNIEGVRLRPNMTFTNRLRAMDERLGDIKTNILTLSIEIRLEQQRFQTWNTDHISQLLSFHHINHTRYDGTPYSYVPNIPDLVVQQGVNFMSNTLVYSTAPSSSPNPFGLFDDTNAGPSTSQNQGNDMDEEKYKHLDILARELDLNGLNDTYHKDYAEPHRQGLFRNQEQVVSDYVLEFLSSFTFKEHIMELANVDTMVFPLGGFIMSRHKWKVGKSTLDDYVLVCIAMDKSKVIWVNDPKVFEECYFRSRDFTFKNEVAEAVEGQGYIEGVRRRPNMTFTNRLRAMDERLGDIKTNILTLSIEVDDLTYVQGVNFMSNTLVYSTAPSSSPNLFGLFDDANAGPSTSQNQGNEVFRIPKIIISDIGKQFTEGIFLVFCQKLVSVETKRIQDFDVKQDEKRCREDLDILEERKEIGSIREAYYKQKLEGYYNKRVRPSTFKPGTYVL
ncbi:hypothetical protein Tco_0116735 [Tanacetum coccineum]